MPVKSTRAQVLDAGAKARPGGMRERQVKAGQQAWRLLSCSASDLRRKPGYCRRLLPAQLRSSRKTWHSSRGGRASLSATKP